MEENDISYKIRGAIFKVYQNLGPGLLESVYATALTFEPEKENLIVKREVPVPVFYGKIKMEGGFRIDLFVENKVIIKIKSVENLAEFHHKQVKSISN